MKAQWGALLLLGAVTCLAEEKAKEVLESFTWHSEGCQLTWVVSKGAVTEKGDYKPASRKTFHIDLHKATMSVNGESRGFTKDEAAWVHRLLVEVMARYTMESTVWWEKGRGERLIERSHSHEITPASRRN